MMQGTLVGADNDPELPIVLIAPVYRQRINYCWSRQVITPPVSPSLLPDLALGLHLDDGIMSAPFDRLLAVCGLPPPHRFGSSSSTTDCMGVSGNRRPWRHMLGTVSRPSGVTSLSPHGRPFAVTEHARWLLSFAALSKLHS